MVLVVKKMALTSSLNHAAGPLPFSVVSPFRLSVSYHQRDHRLQIAPISNQFHEWALAFRPTITQPENRIIPTFRSFAIFRILRIIVFIQRHVSS